MRGDLIRMLLLATTRLIVGGKGEWVGCGPEVRQRIYFANHASHLDTVIIWSSLAPAARRLTRPVAAADYWGSNCLRRYLACGVLNAIIVHRKSCKLSAAAVWRLREELDGGKSLIIFPEGRRSRSDLPAPFKSGLHYLAANHPDVEFIPVYVSNSGQALPKGAVFPVPIRCAARFGAPVRLEHGETRQQFLRRARDAVIALT